VARCGRNRVAARPAAVREIFRTAGRVRLRAHHRSARR
jgi:hypothetical protein